MPQTVRFRKSRKRWVNNRFDLGSLAYLFDGTVRIIKVVELAQLTLE